MLKKFLRLIILLILFLFPIVPIIIDLYLTQVSYILEFIVLIGCLLSAYYITCRRGLRLGKSIGLMIGSLVSLAIVFAGVFCNPYWNSISIHEGVQQRQLDEHISYKNAKADINYMMRYLRKDHLKFKSGMPDDTKQAYEQALKELKNEDEITILRLWQEMERILSTIGDVHTNVAYDRSEWHYFKDYNEV